jgi:hypothetical protein
MLLGTVSSMPSLPERLLALLSPGRRAERRNIDALAARLGASVDDAAWIYGRSREVGYGAAMLEYEERCRERNRA